MLMYYLVVAFAGAFNNTKLNIQTGLKHDLN